MEGTVAKDKERTNAEETLKDLIVSSAANSFTKVLRKSSSQESDNNDKNLKCLSCREKFCYLLTMWSCVMCDMIVMF
eukprot:g36325.t1